MAAAALAAVAAPQVVAGGEDEVRALAVKVLALDELLFFSLPLHGLESGRSPGLEAERGAGAAVDAGRAEAALVVVAVEEVLDLAEQAQPPRLRKRQRVAGRHVALEDAVEAVGAVREGGRVEDGREVVVGGHEVEVDRDARAEARRGDERELVLGHGEGAQDAGHDGAALDAVRVGV